MDAWLQIGLGGAGGVGLVVFVLAVGLVVWACMIEPRLLLDVRRERAVVPHLPADLDGSYLAFLADFQVGMWWGNSAMVRRALREAVQAEPLAIIVGGDLLYHGDEEEVRQVIALMERALGSEIPVIITLGNHDYGLGDEDEEPDLEIADCLVERLQDRGGIVLRNTRHELCKEGGPLHIVGVESRWSSRVDIASALDGLGPGEPRVVVVHNPATFAELPPGAAPVTLAGHTHGGQIRFPFLPRSTSWLRIATQGELFADGWSDTHFGEQGNRLYVNRGIGFSLLPVRFRCRPELTLFRLTSESSTGALTHHNDLQSDQKLHT